MVEARTCPQCGVQLPADASHGLCSQCLLKHGAETAVVSDPTDTPSVARRSPPVTLRYFGDYELLGQIAEGGMGVVWKARQASLNRVVAVKMIRAGKFASADDVKRFHVEAEAAANLQHPNIVAIHEVGEHDGQHYFSMDYVEGRNLAELVRDGPLPPDRAAALIKTMAEAVHYAHQRGILHRDLKPQNVLVDGAGQPRITDFGLAKRLDRDSGLTQTGAVMGTPAYMPPEQASGRRGEFSPASDVYSLGAILYELLAGRPPFRAATPMETLLQVVENEPEPPRKLNCHVPPELEIICLRCLEKRPLQRYPTARDLAEELERFRNHEPILTRPASSIRKVWSWSQKHPWFFTGAASVLVYGLLLVAYGLWAQNRFLLWEKTHPGESVTHFVPFINVQSEMLSGILLVIVFWVGPFFKRHVRECKLKANPVPPAFWAVYALAGVTPIASGAWASMALFDRALREGRVEWQWSPILIAFALFWVGILILWQANREFRFAMFGSPPEHEAELCLEAEQLRDEQRKGYVNPGTFLALLLSLGGSVTVTSLLIRHEFVWMTTLIGWLAGIIVVFLRKKALTLRCQLMLMLLLLLMALGAGLHAFWVYGSFLGAVKPLILSFLVGGPAGAVSALVAIRERASN